MDPFEFKAPTIRPNSERRERLIKQLADVYASLMESMDRMGKAAPSKQDYESDEEYLEANNAWGQASLAIYEVYRGINQQLSCVERGEPNQ